MRYLIISLLFFISYPLHAKELSHWFFEVQAGQSSSDLLNKNDVRSFANPYFYGNVSPDTVGAEEFTSDDSSETIALSFGQNLDLFTWKIGFVDFGEITATDSRNYTSFSGEGVYESTLKAKTDGTIFEISKPLMLSDNIHLEPRIGILIWESELKGTFTDNVTSAGTSSSFTSNFKNDDKDIYLGLGLTYDISPQFSIGLSLTKYSLDGSDINDTSVSARLRFFQ
jgi:hypothetical protein